MPTDVVPAPETVAALPAGTRLGKYQIVRRLGAGGMGTVYEALHAEIGKRVAVKVLSPAVAAMEGARARFLREAQLTSKVHHPHAVDVTDMGTEGEHSFLVMEFLAGEDLATRVARAGRIEPQELVDIVLAVCSAVAAAHRAGIIHRDLKPQNIFLAEGPHGLVPKVLDFGISKGLDASTSRALTSTGSVLGTPYYLAPEQVVDNRTSSPLSDQYAIGIILYECLTATRPFEGESLFIVFQAIVAGSPVAPRQHRPDLAPGLEAVILRAIELDPARRFPSVDDLGRALWPFAGERARLLWRDTFGPLAAGTPRPAARKPMAAETALDPTPRSATPARRAAAPLAAAPIAATPSAPPTPAPIDTPVLRASSSRKTAALLVLALIGAGAGAYRLLRPDDASKPSREPPVATAAPAAPAAPRSYTASVTVKPPTAHFTLDGADAGDGRFERTFTADGATHTLLVSADGFYPETFSFRDAPPPGHVELVAHPPRTTSPPEPPASRPARSRHRRTTRTDGAAAKTRAAPAANPDDAPVIE